MIKALPYVSLKGAKIKGGKTRIFHIFPSIGAQNNLLCAVCCVSGSEVEESLLVSENDVLVGRLLSLATTQCPTLAKAWFSLAGWCYKWGRKAVDSARYVSQFAPLLIGIFTENVSTRRFY